MGIDTYLTVVFWLGILGLIIRLSRLNGPHPRKVEHNVGEDVAALIISIAFFVWICVLKFGA